MLGKDEDYAWAFIILNIYFGNFDLMTLLEINSGVGNLRRNDLVAAVKPDIPSLHPACSYALNCARKILHVKKAREFGRFSQTQVVLLLII